MGRVTKGVNTYRQGLKCKDGDGTDTDNISKRGGNHDTPGHHSPALGAVGGMLAVRRERRVAGGLEERFLVLKGTRCDSFYENPITYMHGMSATP